MFTSDAVPLSVSVNDLTGVVRFTGMSKEGWPWDPLVCPPWWLVNFAEPKVLCHWLLALDLFGTKKTINYYELNHVEFFNWITFKSQTVTY